MLYLFLSEIIESGRNYLQGSYLNLFNLLILNDFIRYRIVDIYQNILSQEHACQNNLFELLYSTSISIFESNFVNNDSHLVFQK